MDRSMDRKDHFGRHCCVPGWEQQCRLVSMWLTTSRKVINRARFGARRLDVLVNPARVHLTVAPHVGNDTSVPPYEPRRGPIGGKPTVRPRRLAAF